MEDKQQFLRQAVLDNGIDPGEFFEHWEGLELGIKDVR